ncbi:hypothetical protein [Mesorhizobium sp. M0968]|uniref:hypothetical protein n=1 Tax=Mesorhizobium sp. M0968 TaxID=2957037 RepID=UPI00333D1FCB
MTSELNSYIVHEALEGDAWTGRIRVHHSRRGGAERFEVVKVTPETGRPFLAVALGHRLSPADIRLDFDQRETLGVREGDSVKLRIDRVGLKGKLWWYLHHGDPAIHVPAWLAFWSVLLGGLGLILSLVSLFR